MAKNNNVMADKPRHDDGAVAGMNPGVAVIGFLFSFLAGGALVWGYDSHARKGGAGDITADNAAGGGAWSDADAAIPVTSADPMWGSRTAPVTIVQFSDFQCPYCSRVEPTIDQVKSTYGKDKVRVIWKNEPLPFHDKARPAAEAAAGVFAMGGNDDFWKFHDNAFKNQGQLSADILPTWAQAAGITDQAKFKAGLAAHTWAAKVDADHNAAKAAGVNGTPGFLINGISISGAQPFDKFKAVIDQELTKAQAKIASGTPKDKIYVVMSNENKKNAPAAPAGEDDSAPKEDTKTVFKVPVGNSPFEGKADAPVTIVEFSDFQCPYCKRVEPTLKQIKDTYGDKVRLVWKNEPLPFHNRALPAAEVAMEALAEKGNKGFWDAHDKLFESQPKLEDADLTAVAAALGLNADKVAAAIKDQKYKSAIDADAALGDDVQASGTPHFFVNGRRLVGAVPFDKFKPIIDEEIAHAQALVAKGTAPAKVYDEMIKDGKGAAALETKTVAISANAPARGNLKGKVVIQEFSDFQCPFCGKVEPTVAQLMKDYGDKVKFVWRNMPLSFHADAPLAAEAAMEAYKQKGNDGFWKMHDTLFANQSKPDGIKRPALEQYASDMGLDMTKFKNALDNSTHKAEIDADAKAGADAQISGTPAFVINGYFINGAQPYAKFEKLVKQALSEAK